MDIDMSALRAIERERDLRLDVLVEACLLYTSRCV